MSTKIQVSSSILESIEAQSMDWKTALGELIDNSFDAGASRVEVVHQDGSLSVSDDGAGCDDLTRMLTIGKTYGRKGGRLGRYGVGFKEAAIWMARRVDVYSIPSCVIHEWSVDWDWVKSHDWETGTNPETCDATIDARRRRHFLSERGMRLAFTRLKHRFPSGKNLAPVLEELGYIFSPALSHGRSIIISNGKRIVVKPYEYPPLENVVDCRLSVSGKEIRIYAGVVPEGLPNRYPGFSYVLHHRVIQAATGLGAMGYSISRVTGRIELNDAWKVGKNKTALVDDDADALERAVFGAVESMLKIAQTQTDRLVSEALKAELTALLNKGRSKAKRGKGEKHGTAKPTGKGSKHTRATSTQPGGSLCGPRNVGGLVIEFTEEQSRGIGWVDLAGNRIWLCVGHPFVSHMLASENRHSLACIASSLYVDCLQRSDKRELQRVIPSMADVHEKFAQGLTDLLAGIPLEKK